MAYCAKPIRLPRYWKAGSRNIQGKGENATMLVPCGKCLGCRIAKRQEWALRLIHEYVYNKPAVFVTLTYDDQHLPRTILGEMTLRKIDLINYHKRLRKNTKRKIKYYACGEYGEKFGRPHLHEILFGFDNTKEDLEIIQNEWPFGHVHLGNVEIDSIRYVTQYIDKKLSGTLLDEQLDKFITPTFKVSSQGLGAEYAKNNEKLIKNGGKLTYNGIPVGIPRYYLKIFGLTKQDIYTKEKLRDKEREHNERYFGISDTIGELEQSFHFGHGDSDLLILLMEENEKIWKQKEMNQIGKMATKLKLRDYEVKK